jgi:hypothetical protein
MNYTISGGAIFFTIAIALQGCALDTAEADSEISGQISSALTPPCDTTWYNSCTAEDDDWSGTVHTAIFVCKLQNSTLSRGSHTAAAACPVPDDYALVGGGAMIDGYVHPGALLTASYPLDKEYWYAASSDLQVQQAHTLRAYAVGLRISGLSGSQLRSIVTHSDLTTPSTQPTSGYAFIPGGHVLVGGGVVAPGGQFITNSFPISAAWVASFTNSVYSKPGGGTIRAISLPNCLPQLGQCTNPPTGIQFRLASQTVANTFGNTGTGYQTAAFGLPDPNAVMTAVGGSTTSGNPGRFLTRLIPAPGGGVAVNKDHSFVDAGGVTAHGVSLKRL